MHAKIQSRKLENPFRLTFIIAWFTKISIKALAIVFMIFQELQSTHLVNSYSCFMRLKKTEGAMLYNAH